MRWPWRRRRPERRAIDSVPWNVGGISPAAASVDRALRLGPVYSAVRLLGDSVSSLPLKSYRKVGEERQRIALPSLFVSPSVQGTLQDWLFRAVTSLALRGNAVGLITAWDREMYPTMIEWLNPDEVHVVDSQPSGPGSFVNPTWYWRGRVVPAENLVHIPWFVLPGRVWGLSPIQAYALTVDVALAAQIYSADWFNSGGAPMGTFRNTEEIVKSEDASIIKRRLVTAIRSHEPVVFGKDWEYNVPISISQQDAAFVETLKLSATQIAGIYGIPPEKIGGEAGGPLTYNTVEQNSIDFIQFALRPWMTRFESAFFRLLPGQQYVRFNPDAMIRVDAKTRWENYLTARRIGLYSVDELRALEDLEPLPDGQGADFTPLAVLEKQAAATPAAGVPAPPGVVPLSGRR